MAIRRPDEKKETFAMQRILIVDDNDESLYYLQALLSASGYEVVTARNGIEALDSALALLPHLVISDILMPVMDGFTLCRRWRGEPRLATIPFAFYTATYTDPKDKELGLGIGADEFVVKPVEPDALLQMVRDLLRRKEMGTLPDRSAAAGETSVFLREYNAALVRKLEDKLVQLEAANQKLTDAKELVQAVLDNSPLPIIVADVEGRITLANPAFAATFGYSANEARGKCCSEIIDPPDVDSETTLLLKQMSDGGVCPHHTKRRRKDGAIIDVEIFLASMRVREKATGLFAIYRDVTEQRKLEDQLRQAQKLEAIGQLAAGVAHDFNNLLGVMVGYSELIRATAEPHSRLFHHAEQIRQACSRASALTGQLLAFSRRQVLLPQVIHFGNFIKEMTAMLRRVTREDIELEVSVQQPVGLILADPVQIEQVVLNLVTNACDAMPKGGRLCLDVCDVDVDEAQARSLYPLRPNKYVKLAMTDTGVGMDEATLARIFEPFFTTKPQGVGTGLGLASVHGIVEQSGGAVLVSSQLGKGSCFELYFPRAHGTASSPSQPDEPSLTGGSETILVAEDEETLRSIVCEMLAGIGYRVLSADSAHDAARILQNTQEHVDLLITDVIMPKMSGRELSELAWSARPEMQVLFISGYEAGLIRNYAGPMRQANFLAKPFSYTQLAAAVRRILDGKQSRAQQKSG
jgi:PAS domain S-box-containing protein